jgi:mannosyltransferase OCH1-like enzyme
VRLGRRAGRIPRRIHYVWFGGHPLTKLAERCLESWRRVLPDYEITRWDESNTPSNPWIEEALRQGDWVMACNQVRLLVLQLHGGIYLDTDVEVVRSFDPLRDLGCFLGQQYVPDGTPYKPHTMTVNDAVLGATAGHAFLAERLARIPPIEIALAMRPFSPPLATATLVDRGLRGYAERPTRLGDLTVFPKEWFYPYFYGEEFDPGCVTTDTFAIHHWAKSW